MRILVHPGFHKTGTTSVQYGLKQRAKELTPHLRALFAEDFPETVLAARRYTAQPAEQKLVRYAEGLAESLIGIDRQDSRPLMISSEKLIGRIPGRIGNWSYDATPTLLSKAADVLLDHFGHDIPITIWFTTREAADWQRSVYWQNLRAMRITEDFDTYKTRLAKAARLDSVVTATRACLSGRAHVTSSAIEDIGHTCLGPLGTALGLLGVPTGDLSPVKAYNAQPNGAADELLALNRSSLEDNELAKAKHELVQSYMRMGKTRRNPAE